MSKKIPKPKKKDSSIISKPQFVSNIEENSVIFSFAPLEWNKYFNLASSCSNWTFDLFNMLKNISKISSEKLLRGEYKTYRIHNHERATPPVPLPDGVELKDCYQLRISTSKGGIHGVFVNNVFYIIWVDPLHNMYPDDRFGGLRVITPPTTCCRDIEEKILILQEENEQLKKDIKYLEEEIEKI